MLFRHIPEHREQTCEKHKHVPTDIILQDDETLVFPNPGQDLEGFCDSGEETLVCGSPADDVLSLVCLRLA